MTIFLILAPFGFFALLMLVTSAEISLFVAAAICLAVIGIDLYRGRSIKMLGAGSVVVFIGLGAYVALVDPNLSASAVKLTVDVGVLAISLASLIIRKPFMLQYALEEVDAETAKLPGFMKAIYIITWAWTAALVLMIIGNVLTIYVPGLPLWSGLVIAFAARNSAAYFTTWYPQYRKAKYGNAAGERPARRQLRTSTATPSSREQDDERRIRQTGRRFFLHHRVPRDLPRHRQRAAGDRCGHRRRGRPGDLLAHQGQGARLHDMGEPGARHRARQRHAVDPRPALRAGETRDRAFRDRRSSCSSAAGCCAICRRS